MRWGLLMTFGNYQSGLTWDVLVVLLSVISILILFYRYRRKIEEELGEFTQSKVGLTLGILLLAISIAFIAETNNFLVITVSASLTIIALLFVLVFVIQRIRKTAKSRIS
jgi:Ca2+/Na+ antiporter